MNDGVFVLAAVGGALTASGFLAGLIVLRFGADDPTGLKIAAGATLAGVVAIIAALVLS